MLNALNGFFDEVDKAETLFTSSNLCTASTQANPADIQAMIDDIASWRDVHRPQVVKLTVGKRVLELLEKLPVGGMANPNALPQSILGIPFEQGAYMPETAVCEHYTDGSVRPYIVKVD